MSSKNLKALKPKNFNTENKIIKNQKIKCVAKHATNLPPNVLSDIRISFQKGGSSAISASALPSPNQDVSNSLLASIEHPLDDLRSISPLLKEMEEDIQLSALNLEQPFQLAPTYDVNPQVLDAAEMDYFISCFLPSKKKIFLTYEKLEKFKRYRISELKSDNFDQLTAKIEEEEDHLYDRYIKINKDDTKKFMKLDPGLDRQNKSNLIYYFCGTYKETINISKFKAAGTSVESKLEERLKPIVFILENGSIWDSILQNMLTRASGIKNFNCITQLLPELAKDPAMQNKGQLMVEILAFMK